MIGLVVGTSEGRIILSKLNEFTRDVFLSTATQYGASIYEKDQYSVLNVSPLDRDGFKEMLIKHNITVFIDSSHPYATQVSENIVKACASCSILYLRYDRKSNMSDFINHPLVYMVDDYEGIKNALQGVCGTVLNTTGSRNIGRIMALKIDNRIIHRVLPTSEVLSQLEKNSIRTDDIIAIKMDISAQAINEAIINAFEIKALITKDSGHAGGTLEKIKVCIKNAIKVIVIKRKPAFLPNTYTDMDQIIEEVKRRRT